MTGTDFTDPLASALWLAGRGYAVHPLDHPALSRCAGVPTVTHNPATCTQRGKHPATKWSATATTDPETIVSWFAGTSRNVGVACKPSGLLVVDEDAPGGFGRFVESVGQAIPDTFTVTTGKGKHYYFTAPSGVVLGNRTGTMSGYGVDVRGGEGHGGYVVAPGSLHASGVLYEPEDASVLALPAPTWLVDALRPSAAGGEAAASSQWEDKPRGLAAVPDVIRGPHPDSSGDRHDVLVRYASSLRARDVPMAEAEALMRTVWQRCEQPPACLTPMTWAEARAELEDVYQRYQPNYPRPDVTVLEEGLDHDDPDAALEVRLAFNRSVAEEAHKLRVRQEAARIVRVEALGLQEPPDVASLAELLTRPVEDRWRVEGLLPAGGRLLWSAQRKTGKTTATGNLFRALLTGEPFLDRFEVTKLDGRIVVLNYEVTGAQYAAWMADIGVPEDRLYVVNLRGRRNLLADEEGRAELVEIVRACGGQVLTVDPFGRAYTGKSQNDTAEVTPWLVRLDEVAERAGCSEVVLTAHAGWDGERTRGSSALEDWPDSIVTMTRDPDTDQRFIKAEGRDVQLDEDRLDYDGASRRLSVSGAGSRKQVRAVEHVEHLAQAVRDVVAKDPGINVAGLRSALRDRDEHLQREDASKAARLAEERGWVRRERGPRNAWQHFPGQPSRVVPESSRGRVVSSPDPSYRDGTTDCTTDQPSSPGREALALLQEQLGATVLAEEGVVTTHPTCEVT